MESLTGWVEQLSTLATVYGIRILGVLAVLVGALFVASMVQRMLTRTLTKANFDLTLTKFFASMSRWAVLVMAFIGCLGVFGIETTSFAAVIGAAGLAVGLAFQGSLGNLAAGIMLLVFRPYKIGDTVNISGVTGKVNEISLFTTDIDTPDNRRLIVPNGTIFGSTIENLTYHENRRVDVHVGAAYDSDIDATRKALESVSSKIDKTLSEPASQVVLNGLGASSVDWTVRVWAKTEDFWAVKEAVTRQVKLSLDEAGVGIPFPQLDIHFPSAGNGIDKAIKQTVTSQPSA